MLNSRALTEAILPFNPKGISGAPHPHAAIPHDAALRSANDDHRRIAALARDIAKVAQAIIEGDAYLNDPSRALPARRRKLRERLRDLLQFQQLEEIVPLH